MALQDIPLRIPDQWSSTWFRRLLAEVLAKADIRNAIGSGITITSDANSVATLTVDPSGSIVTHNDDPFAHVPMLDAHQANRNAHPAYWQIEDMAYFLGE